MMKKYTGIAGMVWSPGKLACFNMFVCVTTGSAALRFHKTWAVHDAEVHLFPSVKKNYADTSFLRIHGKYPLT